MSRESEDNCKTFRQYGGVDMLSVSARARPKPDESGGLKSGIPSTSGNAEQTR